MLKKILAAMLVVPLVLSSGNYSQAETKISQEERELNCLAQNIYYEAANQSVRGQIAVAFVTLNRVSHPSYPKNICGVVHQKYDGYCQFSWVCMVDRLPIHMPSFNEIKRVAQSILHSHDKMKDPTNGALFYHADSIDPPWGTMYTKTVKIGDHVFYRLPKRQ